MRFTRCYGCMGELPVPGGICPNCGYDNTKGPASQPAHALRCGTVLNGHYIVGRSLGQGGFGITYIGYDSTLARRICIKEYFPSGAALRNTLESNVVSWGSGDNAQDLRRGRDTFVKEAHKAVKLRGLDAVVSVWDVFFANETAYIVMEYIDGVTLKDWLLGEKTPLEEADCIQLLHPVMKDLAQVHARGIIHRDISPDNIMLRGGKTPMLLDLGAAKDLSSDQGKSSYVVAKQGFTPLEQYSRQGHIGAWTDVYAMCATIYYCVTGRLLPTPMDRIAGAELNMSAFSPAVAAVLNKGLAIERDKRIQSVEELDTMLTEALAPKPPKKRGHLLWVFCLVGAMALGVFIWCFGAVNFPASGRAAPTPSVTAAAVTAAPTKTAATPVPSPAELNSEELYQRGLACERGEGVTQDYAAALDYYEKAAAKGNASAMAAIGALYYRGAGVQQDYSKALSWFQKAEAAGNTEVLYYIGSMYESVLGVERDRDRAIDYYERAAEVGSVEAEERLNYLTGYVEAAQQQFLIGSWGEPEAIRNGTTVAYYLQSPLRDCDTITMTLRIASYTGYPFGDWYLYAKDMNGNWSHIAQFKIEASQGDGTTKTYELTFDSPQSFQALSICPAEDGMEFTMSRELLFFA